MEVVRTTLQSIAACCMNCREEDTRPGEPTERTPLFVDNRQRITVDESNRRNIRISEDDDGEYYSSSLPKMRDEQTALNKIVQETNSNIIDVAALDTTHVIEQSEYNERVKTYSQRLAHQWNNIQINDVKYNGLLKDVPNPETLLAANQNADDISMIKTFVKEAAQAVSDIKVENNDELVVPFLIT